ncbi:MAG: response regulator [Desulfovibrio sp.]|jgi:CheY-like chemotaxis protein|nr:response regulator [Desulfovibrio sp.]
MRSPFLSCVFVLIFAISAHGKLLTANQIDSVEPLLPYFTWLIDPEGKQTIDTVSSGTLHERFAPLTNGIPLRIQGSVWLRLVIIKSPNNRASASALPGRSRLVMRLGELPSGGAQLFTSESPGPVSAQGVWHSETIASYSDFLLPEPGLLPMSIYLRLDSMPSLWFSPTISPQGSVPPALLPSELILPGLLIVACAACLLRAIAGRMQWGIWAALFLLCVLAQAVLPLPAPNRDIALRDLPAMLAPGMALLLLPHVGRCMFRAGAISTLQDAISYLCSIAGVALCLAPLAPDMFWLSRLFPLWPLLLFPMLPVCVSALANRRPGSLSFTGACVMPLLGGALSLYAASVPNPHALAVQGSLWGLAVGGLGLALARIPHHAMEDLDNERDATADLDYIKAQGETPDALHSDPGDIPVPSPSSQETPLSFSAMRHADGKAVPDPTQEPPQSLQESDAFHSLSSFEASLKKEGAPPQPQPPQSALTESSGNEAWNSEDPAYAYMASVFAPDITPSAPAPDTAKNPAPAATERAKPAQSSFGTGKTHALDGQASVASQSGAYQQSILPPVWDTFSSSFEMDSPQDRQQPPRSAEFAEERGGESMQSPRDSRQDSPREPGLTPDFAGLSDSAVSLAASPKIISLTEEDFSSYPQSLLEDLEETQRHTSLTSGGSFLFNLHSLIREVHDTIMPLAKNKGLLFSWYITPSLPALLEGNAPRLRGALSLLLQNAVQATQQGTVQLAVRQNPNGNDPGDLLFSISDNGSAQRTDAGFFHAWELAAGTGGTFTVEYSPEEGTQIVFTAHFSLPSEEAIREHMEGITEPVRWNDSTSGLSLTAGEPAFSAVPFSPEGQNNTLQSKERDFEPDNDEPINVLWNRSPSPLSDSRQSYASDWSASPHIPPKTGFHSLSDVNQPGVTPLIVAAEMTNSKRKLLSHYLSDLAHEHLDAASNSQVITLIRERPVSLIIFDADMPEPDIISALSALRHEEVKFGQRAVPVLALTNHDAQSQRMLKAGATHILCKPFSRESLQEVVLLAAPSLSASLPGAHGPIAASSAGSQASAASSGRASEDRARSQYGNERQTVDPFVAHIRSGHREQNATARYAVFSSAPDSSPMSSMPAAEATRRFSAGGRDQEGEGTLSRPKDAAPASFDSSSTDTRLHELDLLDAALRNAPAPQGKPVMVSLPPLEEATEPSKQPRAAPMVLSLSEEDVTPSGQRGATPLLDMIITEEKSEDTQSPAASGAESGSVRAPGQAGGASAGGKKSGVSIGAGTASVVRPVAGTQKQPAEKEKQHAPGRNKRSGMRIDIPLTSAATGALNKATEPPRASSEISAEPSLFPVSPAAVPPSAGHAAISAERGDGESADSLKKDIPIAKGTPAKESRSPEADAATATPEDAGSAISAPPAPSDPASHTVKSPAGAETEESPLAADTATMPPQELDAQIQPQSDNASAAFPQTETQLFPLPGLDGETVDMTLLPLVPGLIHALTDALNDARQGCHDGKSILVQEAAGRLASRAEVFGLLKLGKIGQCVERAAEANDLEAVSVLLGDLDTITQRYIDALQNCFQSFISVDR